MPFIASHGIDPTVVNTLTRAFNVHGTTDEVQFVIRGHSTQINALQQWEQSPGTVIAQITNDGQLSIGGTPTDGDILTVLSPATTTSILAIDTTSAGYDSLIQYRTAGSGSWQVGVDPNDTYAYKMAYGAIGSQDKFAFSRNANFGINTTVFDATAEGVLTVAIGTPPANSPTNAVQGYVADVASSAEWHWRDEAGNVTPVSPHGYEHVTIATGVVLPYIIRHQNDLLGYGEEWDLVGALLEVENLSGKTFHATWEYERTPLAKAQDQAASEQLEQFVAKAIEQLVRIPLDEAIEQVEILVKRPNPNKKIRIHQLDPDTGHITITEAFEHDEVPTGHRFALKPGVTMDPLTGECYRRRTREEAIKEVRKRPIQIKPPRPYMQKLLKERGENVDEPGDRTLSADVGAIRVTWKAGPDGTFGTDDDVIERKPIKRKRKKTAKKKRK